ncbi:hypothetical protein IFM89_030834 [Coptis chinensis]|uniref:Uncharacterized protein n=1 Tax=Coptis chinensis TaxID=261450 RepID=A0A835IF28_9MAGN|nr:hypothetical protein IFM89_030834 [Coptis chinensis]
MVQAISFGRNGGYLDREREWENPIWPNMSDKSHYISFQTASSSPGLGKVVLVDGDGIVRADVPFRRAKSKYSVKQVGVTVEFYGGQLDEVSYSDPATVKKYARHAQLGENFELDHAILKSDGVFHSSPRGNGNGNFEWRKEDGHLLAKRCDSALVVTHGQIYVFGSNFLNPEPWAEIVTNCLVRFNVKNRSNAGGSMKTDDRDLALCSMILGIRTEDYGSKKVSSMRFSWGKLGWKASDQDECVICLERFKYGETLVYFPPVPIVSFSVLPWLEKNAHCACYRTNITMTYHRLQLFHSLDAYGGAARDHERRVVFAYSGNNPTRSVILSDTQGRCTCYRETTRLADYLAMLIFGSTAPRIEYLHGFKTMSTTSKLICLSWMRSTYGRILYDLERSNAQTFILDSFVASIVDGIRLSFTSNHGGSGT